MRRAIASCVVWRPVAGLPGSMTTTRGRRRSTSRSTRRCASSSPRAICSRAICDRRKPSTGCLPGRGHGTASAPMPGSAYSGEVETGSPTRICANKADRSLFVLAVLAAGRRVVIAPHAVLVLANDRAAARLPQALARGAVGNVLLGLRLRHRDQVGIGELAAHLDASAVA